MKKTVLRWLTLAGMILALAVTITKGMEVNNQTVEYQEVEVKVVSTDKRRVKKQYYHEVEVEYKGKKYELKNVRDEEFARYKAYTGRYVTVYYANDKMYSNITGIKTDGKAYYIYLGALAGTIVFLILHIGFVKEAVKEK